MDGSMLDDEELHVAAPNGGEVEVYTCPAVSSAMQLVLEGQARAEKSLAPGIDAGADQLAAVNGGVDDLSRFPLKSVATHTPADAQASAEMPFASTVVEGADQVEPPPDGLVEVRTEPLSSNATHALLDAHARLKIPPPFGSTSDELHAAAPLVGFVEVRIRPARSLPTHIPLDGHDCENISTGFSPGATSSGDVQVARSPCAAVVVLDTCPLDVPPTHRDAAAPAHANAFEDPAASVSATHVAPPSAETLVVEPLLEKQIAFGAGSAASGAHVRAITDTDGVDKLHAGVASPGSMLVAIRFAPLTDPAAMQNVVVGHEKPVIELRPVDDEVADDQEKALPGVAELRTVPFCSAAKQRVADGHAKPANGAAPHPTSSPALGLAASPDAHKIEPLPPTHTVVEAPAAHAGASTSSGGEGANR
jgi:hypothetical protein